MTWEKASPGPDHGYGHMATITNNSGGGMDAVTAWVTKHWLPLALVCIFIGLTKVIRGVARGEKLDWKDVLAEFFSTLIGGALAMFGAIGAGFTVGWILAAYALGCWMGVSLYRIGEEEVKGRNRR
jgi:di/tricarboxylate transporter